MSETEERIERFAVMGRHKRILRTMYSHRPDAERDVAFYDSVDDGHAPPHRVVHLVELRPGERIVREDEG